MKTKYIVKRISHELNKELMNNFLDVRRCDQLKFVGGIEFDTEKEALEEGLKIVSEAFDNNDKELAHVAITAVDFEGGNVVGYCTITTFSALTEEVFTVDLTGGKDEDECIYLSNNEDGCMNDVMYAVNHNDEEPYKDYEYVEIKRNYRTIYREKLR
jgi:hypothetical protein